MMGIQFKLPDTLCVIVPSYPSSINSECRMHVSQRTGQQLYCTLGVNHLLWKVLRKWIILLCSSDHYSYSEVHPWKCWCNRDI